MIKLVLINGHDIEVITFMLCMAVDALPGNCYMKAFVFFDSRHKFLVTRAASRIRDPAA